MRCLMRRIALAVALVALLPLVADGQDWSDFQIGPGSVLDITVWKNDLLSRLVLVCPDDKISFPLLNEVQAAGLTTAELRDVLTKRLKEFIPNPEVSVRSVRIEKGEKIVIVRPKGAMKKIPFNYNKVAGD